VTARCIPAKLHIKIGVFSGSNIALQNASPVASRMLRIMQQLSADAAKAGAASMTHDEINAEIVVARNEKVKF